MFYLVIVLNFPISFRSLLLNFVSRSCSLQIETVCIFPQAVLYLLSFFSDNIDQDLLNCIKWSGKSRNTHFILYH